MKKAFVALALLFCTTVLQAAPLTVKLVWTASTTTGVTYNVYRGTVSGGPYTMLNLSAISALTYTDANPVDGANYYVVTAVKAGSPESVRSNQVLAQVTNPTPPPSTTSIYVNSGGPAYTAVSGAVWQADTGFVGGSTYSTTATVTGTPDAGLYKNERWGAFTYTFTPGPGSYDVTLKFAETSFNAAGQRIFNVTLNGAPMLTNFDIFTAAGGRYKAVDKTQSVTTTDGKIVIAFVKGSPDYPKVDAIQIDRTSVAPPPVTLTCATPGRTCIIGGGVKGQSVDVQIAPNGPKVTVVLP